MRVKLLHLLYQGLYNLSKPFHWLKDRPVLYRGKNISVVNLGLFASLDGIAVLTIFLLYVTIVSGQITTVSMLLKFLLPVFVWFGARSYAWAAQGYQFLKNPRKFMRETGFYVQGGIIGGVIWALIVARITGTSLLIIGDGLSWGFLLGQFFGRLGCFNYGCCYGRQTHKSHAIHYTNVDVKVLRLHPELKNVPLIPSQIYQALVNLIAFVIFTFLIMRMNRHGLVTGLFMVYYGTARMLFETVRADIYFDGKRKWITFYFSLAITIAGVAFLAAGGFLFPQLFAAFTPALPMSFRTLETLFITTPYVRELYIWVAMCLFLGFGIHGKTLGTFPSFRSKSGKAINHSHQTVTKKQGGVDL